MTNDAANTAFVNIRTRHRRAPVIARTTRPWPKPTMTVLIVNTAPVTQPGSPSTVVA